MPREAVRKIAVLRANGLGDLVFSLPALEALRAHFASAEIVLLGRSWHQALLSTRPSPVDRVEVVPDAALNDARAEMSAEAEVEAFLERMRAEAFDLALQLHGGGRNSNPLVLALGARTTAGMRTPDAAPLDRWIPYVYYQAEIPRYLEVVGLVGARPVTLRPRLPVTDADLAASTRAIAPDDRPVAVLHPGANDPRRRWPAERFAAVGARLRELGARVIVTGASGEAAIVEAVRSAAGSQLESACGGLDLPALVGTLARAAVVVSNDTGPMHVAAAVGTPTVGIYWCGNLVNGGPLTVDRHRHVTSWRLTCPTCGMDCTRGSCQHDDSFVADVEVAEVMAVLEELLSRYPLERPKRVTRRGR